MKSLFKKIALVLTLALVIGLVPANTANAAATPGLKYASKILYVNGDASGKYEDWCWTPSQNTTGYDVAYEVKSGKDLITVAKNGKITVTGEGVGKAVVGVTYTSKTSGASKTADFTVYVKQNATLVKFMQATEKVLAEALNVGDVVTTKAAKTADNKFVKDQFGINNYTGIVTDLVKITSSDENVIKVDGFKLEAVGSGTATITVQTYQKESQLVTAEKEYQVAVEESFSAKQSAWNAIEVTFKDHETANNAVEATKPSLNTADAAVTEDKKIIKVYKVLKDTDGYEVSAFIGSLGIPTNSNVVTVGMFDELEEDTEYIVRYQDKETRLKTTKYVADSLEIVVESAEKLTESSSKTTLGYRIYTTGTEGQRVDISGCKGYEGWRTGVQIEDLNTAEYHAEYTFDKSTPAIWFYTAQPNYAVNVKAVFEDWFNVINGKANVLSTTKTITPGDTSVKIGTLLDWGVIKTTGDYSKDEAYAVKKFAVADDEYGLAVKIQITEYGNTAVVRNSGSEADKFTFVSSNDDKLAVHKEKGALYPPKDPMDGIVPVYVYYDEQFVGVCPVQVYAKRTLTTFTASLDSTKLSYNPDKDVNDKLTLTFNANDQLGAAFNNSMNWKAEVYGETANSYVTIHDMGYNSDGRPIFEISGTKNLPTNVTTIRIVCTATYDEGGKSERTMKYSVTLTAKNTSTADVKSYSLVTSGPMDMILDNNADHTNNKVANKVVKIAAYSFDKDGYKVSHLYLNTDLNATSDPTALAENEVYLSLKKGSDHITDNITIVGRDIEFRTVKNTEIQIASGFAVHKISNGIEKIDPGTYVANLFIGNSSGKAVFRASAPIVITDTQPSVVWNWDKFSTSETITGSAIRSCFTFKYDVDGNGELDIVNSDIYLGYIEKDKEGNYTQNVIYTDDFDQKGNKLTVRQVRYLLELTDGYYELVIPVMRTITMNVTQ